MAHYAKVKDGIVQQVIVADSDFFETFIDSSPGKWIQTSYNTHGGVHYDPVTKEPDGGIPLRKNFAGLGFSYDEGLDAFIPPKKFDSWIFNEETCLWDPPIAYPDDGKKYDWDEETISWNEV